MDKCICIESSSFHDNYEKLPESFCNGQCLGNPLQTCGDVGEHFSIFDTALYSTQEVSDCVDYFKLGMVPMIEQCVTLKFGDERRECCWNSLQRTEKVYSIKTILFFRYQL